MTNQFKFQYDIIKNKYVANKHVYIERVRGFTQETLSMFEQQQVKYKKLIFKQTLIINGQQFSRQLLTDNYKNIFSFDLEQFEQNQQSLRSKKMIDKLVR